MATGAIYGHVARLVTLPGMIFPTQVYYRASTPDDPWTVDRDLADPYPWDEAGRIASSLSKPDCRVFPVTIHTREEPPMPARDFSVLGSSSRQDWHAGKPNCGVD